MLRNSTQYVCANGRGRLVTAMLACILLSAYPAATKAENAPGPASTASCAEAGRAVVTVRIHDYAGVPGKMLLEAAQDAQRIFRKAGIETKWVIVNLSGEEDAGCEMPTGLAPRTINIIPRSLEYRLPRPEGRFGVAALSDDGQGGRIAYVFYSRVLQEAMSGRWWPSSLLGDVIAHEVGHLLLGRAHSPRGLMSAKWDAKALAMSARGLLLFGDDEAARLQAEAGGRTRTNGWFTTHKGTKFNECGFVSLCRGGKLASANPRPPIATPPALRTTGAGRGGLP